MSKSIHSMNVLDVTTGLVHAPYAKLSLDYKTYATACLQYIDVEGLRATVKIATCLGCVVKEVPDADVAQET